MKGESTPFPSVPPPCPAAFDVGDPKTQSWKSVLPTKSELLSTSFGKPDSNHSFTQEACCETALFLILKSGYLIPGPMPKRHTWIEAHETWLNNIHPLILHLSRMIHSLEAYDFRWIRSINRDWASQTTISLDKRLAMMACLFHFNMDVGLLMRYLGNNYTGSYRQVMSTVATLNAHDIDPDLIQHYIRVMTVGCPNIFVAKTTRANAVEYWRAGNNPSIKRNLAKVMTTMNKEERNNFVVPRSGWAWRFIPHLMIVPQHHHEVVGKKGRQIGDATFRHNQDSIPVNMMTSSAKTTELRCKFGDVKQRLYRRIYNLRITYPQQDIIIHANDVKSCFRQLKHHPDIMGAFSYILDDILFLQIALSFGADFSPANWEVVRRIAEILAEKLFDDDSLRDKHRQYLDRLSWQPSLGSTKARFTLATADSINTGVRDATGTDAHTPHDFYVDDDVYAEVYAVDRIEQAIAASIEAIFILLGQPALNLRQHPVSFDKLEETRVDWMNRLLGLQINTRQLTVRTPPEYVAGTVNILRTKWHKGKLTWLLLDMESLTGRLGHIADTLPWLRYLMSHLYTSITHAIGTSQAHLIDTRKDFRDMLKLAKGRWTKAGTYWITREAQAHHSIPPQPQRRIQYAASKSAKLVHRTSLVFGFNYTLHRELRLVLRALESDWIDMCRPLGHMIPRDPSGVGYSDSCLHAAGGFSYDMGFWWYFEWPQSIQACTLKFITNDSQGNLITINSLEYASLIIEYVAAFHALTIRNPSPADPHPVVCLFADNTTAEAWIIKASKASLAGRALGRIQASLMINNPVGINVNHVTSSANVVADRISRILTEANLLSDMQPIFQDFPALKSCQRFHPSAELISLILDTLLHKKFVDPLLTSRAVLAAPGRITT